MDLTILERLMILNALPPDSNYATQKILQRLRLAIGFSEEDYEKYSIVVTEGNIAWKDEAEPANIPIGKVAHAEIVKALEQLDKDNKVAAQHLSVFEKFGFDED